MATIEVKVPDIGDYDDVPVIELLVAVGDTVKQGPGPGHAGVGQGDDGSAVVGRRRGQGTEGQGRRQGGRRRGDRDPRKRRRGRRAEAQARRLPPRRSRRPVHRLRRHQSAPSAACKPDARAQGRASGTGRKADIECRMVVLGSGPGGYTAAFRAADLGLDTVLVERYATLGGVCLNVGCIPSKALLHAAALIEEAAHAADYRHRLRQAEDRPRQAARLQENKVVGQFTKGLAGMAKQRKVRTVQGVAKFVSPNELEIAGDDGKTQLLRFEQCIIAAGSQAVKLPNFPWDDPRVMDSTDALELADVPKKLLVVGGGIIGLEMATVYRALGSEVTVVEFMDQLMPGTDKDLVKPLADRLKKQGVAVHLKTKARKVEASKNGITVSFEGAEAGAGRATHLRSRAGRGRPLAQRRQARCRQGRRAGHRARLHPGRPADAHQRAAHLRHRRPRRPADARAQGHARRQARGGSRRRREARVGRARDSVGGLHRSGNRLGRRHRDRSQGQGPEGRRRQVPVGGVGARGRHRPQRRLHQADLRREDRIASSAAASSACMRAT